MNMMNEMNFIKRELKDTKALLNSTIAQLNKYRYEDSSNKENIYMPQNIEKVIEITDVIMKNQIESGIIGSKLLKPRLALNSQAT